MKVGKNYKLELSSDLNGSQNGQFHFCAILGYKRAQKGEGSMIVRMQHQRQYNLAQYATILTTTGDNTLVGGVP